MSENNLPAVKRPRYIENSQGNQQLIDDDNHLYHVTRKVDGTVYWVCAMKKKNGCPGKATVYTQNDSPVEKVVFSHEHSHLSNLPKVQAKIMDRETIKDAMSNLNTAPSRILADSTNKHSNGEIVPESVLLARRKSANLIRSMQVHRVKVKGHNSVPATMEWILENPLPENYSKTVSGDNFLILKDQVTAESTSSCLLVFMSTLGKELLRSSKHWVSDGTFKTCPKPFPHNGQIYIMFAELKTGLLLPCAFSFLPDKNSDSYYRMWGAIHNELTNSNQVKVTPESIGMDFEVAPANQFTEFFPDAKNCWLFFPLEKSSSRTAQQKRLQKVLQWQLQIPGDRLPMCFHGFGSYEQNQRVLQLGRREF
jgi:hypothetical protein